jgi:PHD/YefM family antitoxin component YafN of YafNO toxin-antitoxin module
MFDHVMLSGEPVKITTNTGNVVLVSEEVWNGVEETLKLVSIPGMRDSLAAAEEVMDENERSFRCLHKRTNLRSSVSCPHHP